MTSFGHIKLPVRRFVLESWRNLRRKWTGVNNECENTVVGSKLQINSSLQRCGCPVKVLKDSRVVKQWLAFMAPSRRKLKYVNAKRWLSVASLQRQSQSQTQKWSGKVSPQENAFIAQINQQFKDLKPEISAGRILNCYYFKQRKGQMECFWHREWERREKETAKRRLEILLLNDSFSFE